MFKKKHIARYIAIEYNLFWYIDAFYLSKISTHKLSTN